MYDLDNLTNTEVKKLIAALKTPIDTSLHNEINKKITNLLNSIKLTEAVIDVVAGIEYKLHIYRGQRDLSRYSIHIRFSERHHTLVRVDIGSGHTNPDGTRIDGDHIHIYDNQFSNKTNYAVSLQESDFPIVQNIVDAVDKFLRYTNIK